MTNFQTPSGEMETKTETLTCGKHGEYEAEFFRVSESWLGGKCPKCAEEDKRREEDRREQMKAVERKARIDALVAHSGIPKRFSGRTLDNYQADGEGQKRALQIARKMADSKPDDGVSLVFCGKPGTGKTHLACGISDEWLKSGRPALFMTVLAAIRSIKATYNRDSEKTEDDAVRALTEIDLLILDEIGVQLGTEHEKMLLFEIINERYQQMRSTVLISNLTKGELTEYLGDRVMDRFRECGAVVAFDWQSYRGGKK